MTYAIKYVQKHKPTHLSIMSDRGYETWITSSCADTIEQHEAHVYDDINAAHRKCFAFNTSMAPFTYYVVEEVAL